MRQVAKQDMNEASKIMKEMLTYDLPQLFKNFIKNNIKKRN